MRVGISLLTLAPGRVGGSETYARALCPQALDRVGINEYTSFVSKPLRTLGGRCRPPSSARTGQAVAVLDGSLLFLPPARLAVFEQKWGWMTLRASTSL